MLHNISWGQFLTLTGTLMTVYYLYIIVAYFRKDIKALITKRAGGKPATMPAATINGPDLPPPGTNTYDTHITTVHELMDGLNNVFKKCASQDFQKPELMMAVQLKLGDYQQLKGTPFQVSVNNQIETEALSKCGIRLEENDLKSLW